MSGDMDTALGNCTTMCAMMWSFMRHLGLTKFEFANDGDDGVLIVEEDEGARVLHTFRDYFLRFGFQMKLEGTATKLEDIEFCQAHPIWVNGSYRMVRDPRVCLAKDSFCLRNYRTVEDYRHFRASVGYCGLSLAGDMPIFSALYRKFVEGESDNRDTAYETGMQFMAHGMGVKCDPVSDETRVSFWEAYDISPDEQVNLENLIRSTSFALDVMPVDADRLPSIYSIPQKNPRH